MKIYYFLKDDSNDQWHDIELIAWQENENSSYDDSGNLHSSFKLLENIRLHVSKGERFHCKTFKAEFGKDTSIGSFAKNSKELIKHQTENATMYSSASIQVDRNEYECLRKKVIEIYQKEMFLDLDKLTENQPKTK